MIVTMRLSSSLGIAMAYFWYRYRLRGLIPDSQTTRPAASSAQSRLSKPAFYKPSGLARPVDLLGFMVSLMIISIPSIFVDILFLRAWLLLGLLALLSWLFLAGRLTMMAVKFFKIRCSGLVMGLSSLFAIVWHIVSLSIIGLLSNADENLLRDIYNFFVKFLKIEANTDVAAIS